MSIFINHQLYVGYSCLLNMGPKCYSCLVIMIFLFFFPPSELGILCCVFPMYLGASYAFNDISITYQKKKKMKIECFIQMLCWRLWSSA
jgi:uncharacterized membrane protein